MDETRLEHEYELKSLCNKTRSIPSLISDERNECNSRMTGHDLETETEIFQTGLDDTDYRVERADYSGDGNVESLTGSEAESERETWTRGLDFILTLLGYSVGLGNLWRFPYLCMRNGGGAFLIPFLICLTTCGLPMFFLEISLGQFLGKSSMHAWIVCPLFKGLGIGMMVLTTILVVYFNMIIAWTLYYIVNSFSATLPWSTCGNWWNTEACFVQGKPSELSNSSLSVNVTVYSINETTTLANDIPAMKMSSEEEFWIYNALQMSSGLDDFGTPPWHLIVCYFCAWTIVFLCIMKGVKSVGKVVYVTALLPYVLLTVLLIKGLTLEGSVDGIIYYLTPDLKRMMTAQVWVEAALQVFYSLGPGWGPLISMASYNRFDNNCLRDSLIICFIGEGTSIFCGFVIFATLGFISHELQLPIEEVVNSGPGLGFVAYPKALARLPLPQFWACLFFIMLLTVGLDSMFSSVESIVACIMDIFPKLRNRRFLVSMFSCIAGFVVGIPFCFQGGIYIFQLVDWYIASLAIPVFGILECFIFGWVYGAERFNRDIRLMIGRDIPLFMRISWCFVTPTALALCLISSLITYAPPSIGKYRYPVFGQILGWTIALIPIIPVIIVVIKQLLQNRDKHTFLERLSQSLKPSENWQPQPHDLHKTYNANRYSYSGTTALRRIRINVLGDHQ